MRNQSTDSDRNKWLVPTGEIRGSVCTIVYTCTTTIQGDFQANVLGDISFTTDKLDVHLRNSKLLFLIIRRNE